jgi:5'-deoxynucleotidase YfbR-like HD superfamily hydrolase
MAAAEAEVKLPSIEFVYEGGLVKRFHTMDTLKENSVAQHSFGVAWLCYLAREGKPSLELIMAALAHDLAEQAVGDIPSPAKRDLHVGSRLEELEARIRDNNGLPDLLSDEEQRTLKLADCLDGMMFCLHELRRGNKNVCIVFDRYRSYIEELQGLTAPENEMVAQVLILWRLELYNA